MNVVGVGLGLILLGILLLLLGIFAITNMGVGDSSDGAGGVCLMLLILIVGGIAIIIYGAVQLIRGLY